jgi:hypothetical protein
VCMVAAVEGGGSLSASQPAVALSHLHGPVTRCQVSEDGPKSDGEMHRSKIAVYIPVYCDPETKKRPWGQM